MKFIYNFFKLAFIALAIFTLFLLCLENEIALLGGIGSLILLGLMWLIRSGTQCPICKKDFVAKMIGDEDLGVCSNAFRKKFGDAYHTYEKHKCRYYYECTACGHKWQRTVEEDKRLD